MGNVVTLKGRLADPRHVVLDEPVTNMTGLVEVVLRPAPSVPVKTTSPADRVARARDLQSSAPPQQSDSAALVRDDRQR
jgi:hypothetical protein